MAKRKRLTPPQPGALAPATPGSPPLPAFGRVPIAQVAGDASATAAFEAVRDELQAAQREGRMVLSLPLPAIRADYLIRDRLVCDADDMDALMHSIRERGQQTPIEVADLGDGTYGLISGWRRLQALAALHEDSGGLARFSVIQALLRLPADRPAAYIAMLEENEVRANLSFYERARIVVQSVEAGVFDSDKKALQSLFSTASFSKRSKIKSFMPLVRALDGVLRYPAQISERLGLALSRGISDDPGRAASLKQALISGAVTSPEEERLILERRPNPPEGQKPKAEKIRATAGGTPGTPKDARAPGPDHQGVSAHFAQGRIVLEGKGVNSGLIQDLRDWLEARNYG